MPPIATTAGSGSLNIRGSLDTKNIDTGFRRVKNWFDNTKSNSRGFNSELKRMSQEAGRLAKRFSLLAVTGITAISALASKAPAVAPAMAKMGVTFGKIQRSLGEALAPAFERVAGWLDKLSVWIATNKEGITEVANKFLDWGEKVGTFLWPWLEKIGNWAADHPGLFAGIIAGLALTPAIISGIGTISSLVTLLTGGGIVSASLLTALGALGFIGSAAAVGGAGYVAAAALVDKLQNYTGMGTDPNAPTDMSGQTLLNRLPQSIKSSITGNPTPWNDPLNANSPAFQSSVNNISNNGYQQTPNGMMSANTERDRRQQLLAWWDALWG